MTSKVLALFSTKGGVGKTLIATNLATTLSVHQGKKTTFLTLTPVRHDSVTMLGATGVHSVTEPVTIASLPSLLADLRHTFAYVVIDAGSVLNELAVTALEHSNLVVLVTTPDLLSMHHAVQTVETLEAMQFPLRMLKAVIPPASCWSTGKAPPVILTNAPASAVPVSITLGSVVEEGIGST